MKIPESIRIGGVEYAIERGVTDLNDGINMLMGQIHYSGAKILISDKCENQQQEALTLLHEILHGIARDRMIEMENEEDIVETFARGIYQLLQDNAGRLFDLAPIKREGAE